MQDSLDELIQDVRRELANRQTGAPKRKRNLYEGHLTPERQETLGKIESHGGLAWEIGLLRPRVAAVLNDPDADLNDVLLATQTLVKLLRADKKMDPARWNGS